MAEDKTPTLDEQIQALNARQNEIVASVGDSGWTDDVRKEFDANESKLGKFLDQKADEKRIENARRRSAYLAEPLKKDDEKSKVGRVHDNVKDDPKKGFASPREFILSVLNVGMGKSEPDQRLRILAAAGSDEQGVYSDPYGGFLVPTGFTPDVLQLEAEDDQIAQRVTRVPMATPRVEIPARVDKNHTSSVSGGLTVSRRGETSSISSSRMEFEKVSLVATGLYGLTYVTEELLTDSPQSFAAILAAGFGDEFRSQIMQERLAGTGVGEFEGILNSPALVSIAKETGQAATTIVYENLVKMLARCWRSENAVWVVNHDCIPQLAQLSLSVGTGGGPIWIQSAVAGLPDMLLGRPVVYSEYCKTLGTKGDIYLANWSQYLEGVYQPMQSAESMHVRFVNHERTFKFWVRNAGMCWWRSALTPDQGSNTRSPFVSLDTRA